MKNSWHTELLDILVCENILKEMDLFDAAFVIDFVRDWAQKQGRIVIVALTPPTMELLTMFRKSIHVYSRFLNSIQVPF